MAGGSPSTHFWTTNGVASLPHSQGNLEDAQGRLVVFSSGAQDRGADAANTRRHRRYALKPVDPKLKSRNRQLSPCLPAQYAKRSSRRRRYVQSGPFSIQFTLPLPRHDFPASSATNRWCQSCLVSDSNHREAARSTDRPCILRASADIVTLPRRSPRPVGLAFSRSTTPDAWCTMEES